MTQDTAIKATKLLDPDGALVGSDEAPLGVSAKTLLNAIENLTLELRKLNDHIEIHGGLF